MKLSIVRNKIIPFGGFKAVLLLKWLFVRMNAIIPEQMSIEQFCGGIKKKDSVVTELVDKHCYYV